MKEEKRKISVGLNLHEEDLKKVLELCGSHNLSMGQLLENFISDLVDGKQSNGSDEREAAGSWFRRCWFGMFPEETFLRYVILYGNFEAVQESILKWKSWKST